jgi:hypothetical protein
VPPVRLVARFATHDADVEPATPLPGNSADPAALKLAAAVVATAGDVLARAKLSSSGHGLGLRGGTFHVTEKRAVMQVTLNGVRWTQDLAVSGSLQRYAGADGRVNAEFTLDDSASPEQGGAGDSGRARGQLRLNWRDGVSPSDVEIAGQVGNATLHARHPAP